MPAPEFWMWFLTAISPTGLLLATGYIMRDSIGRYLTKGIEHRFDKKIESFKSNARDNEKELEQIRSFLVSAQKDRDVAFQTKRFEAAEKMMQSVQIISQLSMAVEYMKILNVDEIMKIGDNQNTINFINAISLPIDIDTKMKKINEFDMTLPRLFLSDKTLKVYDAYMAVYTGAAMMIKILAVPLKHKGDYLKKDGLTNMIVELIPSSKEGFNNHGETYAYYWATYLHNEILRSLRSEVSGIDSVSRDAKFAAQSAIMSRQARANIDASLQAQGLPEKIISLEKL